MIQSSPAVAQRAPQQNIIASLILQDAPRFPPRSYHQVLRFAVSAVLYAGHGLDYPIDIVVVTAEPGLLSNLLPQTATLNACLSRPSTSSRRIAVCGIERRY